MEKYRAPPTFEITDQTQLADWKKWQKSYRSYALASNLVEKSHDFQLSSFKSLLGERALEAYRSFSIVDTTDVESVFGKFDELFGPKVNSTRERYKLYRLSQKSGQRFDDFLSNVTNLVDKCRFRSTRDEIVLYKIVGGILNDDVREALLAEENLQYEKAVQICRASSNMHFMSSIRKCDEDEQKEQRDPVKNSKLDLKRSGKHKIGNRPKGSKSKGDLKRAKTVEKGRSPREKSGLPSAAENVGKQGSAIFKGCVDKVQKVDPPIEKAGGRGGVEKVEKSVSLDERADPENHKRFEKASSSVEKAGLSNDRSMENVSTDDTVGGNEPADIAQEPDILESSLIELDCDWRPDDDDDDDDPDYVVPETVVNSGKKLKSTPVDDGKHCEKSRENITCKVCGRVFLRKTNLQKHSLIHLREKDDPRHSITRDAAIDDPGDNIEAKTPKKLKTKLANRTLVEKCFPCEVCGKVFPRKKSMKRHSLTHSKGRNLVRSRASKVHDEKATSFTCNVCNKVFPHKNNLQRHRLIHVEAKVFTCYYCQGKFALKMYVLRHMMKKHSGEVGVVPKVHTCDKCDYKTMESKNMKRHMFKHSDVKPLSCELCQYQCIVQSQMISHMAKHYGEKPFACTHCDFRSTSDSALSVHRKLKHSDGKPFTCKVCGHSFKLRSALRSHMYIHTGERPYACTVCDSKFRQSAHLAYHMRTHTGEKPYVCDICGHRWAIQGNLTAHMKIHNKQSDPSQNSPSRKRHKKPKPDQAVEAPAPAAIPQWSEQISTINPVECFTGLEPYPAYPLGTRPAGSDCRYYQQRPSQWPNSQNVSNAMPVIASEEFQ